MIQAKKLNKDESFKKVNKRLMNMSKNVKEPAPTFNDDGP